MYNIKSIEFYFAYIDIDVNYCDVNNQSYKFFFPSRFYHRFPYYYY